MTKLTYNVSKEFSRHPGGRDKSDGPFSGEEFRDTILVPFLKKGNSITLEMDGTRGFPPSFLEETFGGLIRLGYTREELAEKITIVTLDSTLKKEITNYIEEAVKESKIE
jgi:hypothetical protein